MRDIAISTLNDEPEIPVSVSSRAADLIRQVRVCTVQFLLHSSRSDIETSLVAMLKRKLQVPKRII
jgi:hypothetical protein